MVVSFIRTTEDEAAVGGLASYGVDVKVIQRDSRYSPWKLVRGLVGPTPFPILNYRDRRMIGMIQRVRNANQFDIVQAEDVQMAQYCTNLTIPTVLDMHNVESVLMQRYAKQERHPLKRLYARVTWKKLQAYERWVCSRFTHCLVCSEDDRARLNESCQSLSNLTVIPNGVDVEDYEKLPKGIPRMDGKEQNRSRLVFVGRMDYHACVEGVRWFVQEVLPRVKAHKRDVLFQIVGGCPVREVLTLAQPGLVEVTGFVEDVRPYLAAATVVVVPLRVGGGTRLKILEALAMRKAVVSTAIGAEGLATVHDKELIIADDPRFFAQQIVNLIEHPDRRIRLGLAGHQLVRLHYGWSNIAERLEGVYQGALRQAACSQNLKASYPNAESCR